MLMRALLGLLFLRRQTLPAHGFLVGGIVLLCVCRWYVLSMEHVTRNSAHIHLGVGRNSCVMASR